MGLDIYFYKVKAQGADTMTNENITLLNDLREIERSKDIPAETRVHITDLINQCIECDSAELRAEIILSLKPFIKYNHMQEYIKSCDVKRLKDVVEDIVQDYITYEDMYFRKVNLLYAFFAEKLTDEQCIVTKREVETIISNCEKVLADHSLAETLLPTQGGFFFGSTDYNEWYFNDVEEVLNSFTEYLKDWTDDTIGWVYFSW